MDKFGFSTIDTNSTSITVLVFFLLGSMMIYFIKNWISNYLKKRNRLKDLAEKYNKKLECRSGLAVFFYLKKYHFYWQLNSGERASARNLSNEILELDEELKELYDQYLQLKEKGSVDLKKL